MKKLFKKVKLNWSFNPFGKKKAFLAFEFGIVLSDAAKQMKIEMTSEIVLRAEKMLLNELRDKSAQEFACEMNVLVLAVLEPKDLS